MIRDQLAAEILVWAEKAVCLSQEVLDKSWDWQGYSEGIRFAFFRVIEELRAMTVDNVCNQPYRYTNPSRAVQQLLTQYHAAFWDLRSLCLGLTDETADRKPTEEDWSLKQVIQHTLDAEWAFFGVFQYTYRFAGTREDWKKDQIPESFFDLHFSDEGLYSDQDFEGNLMQLLGLYENLHRQIMIALSTMRDGHLQDELYYWEPQPMNARFRLIRFETHLRQHSIQAEKTMSALGNKPSGEVYQLVNLCLQAYADLDAILFFNHELNQEQIVQYWNENIKPFLDVILAVLPS